MNLAVDIGNTAIKCAFFDGDHLIQRHTGLTEETLKQIIKDYKPENVIISSTGSSLGDWISGAVKHFVELNHTVKLSFELGYKTPETLGADRIAGVSGAQKLFPKQNILVIDAGTCITYDYLSEENVYHGGGISPGLKMRFKAMEKFTARLPEIDIPVDFPQLIGNTTKSSMESGTIYGMLFEMEGAIAAYKKKVGGLKVILTGGDSVIFDKKLKQDIFAAPDLILIGLNVILQNNVAYT